MTRLTDIIEIQISRETAVVSQTSFNVPLFIAAHTVFKERARLYSDIDDVLADFGSNSKVYAAASQMFSQGNKPANIVIGRRQIPSVTASISTVQNTTTYTLTVSDVPYSITSGSSATAVNIAAALRAAYQLAPQPGVTITDNLDGTLSIAATQDWSLKATNNITLTSGPSSEAWADTLAAVEAANNEWYGLTTETHATADVLELAAAIETRRKIYAVSSQAASTKSTASDDLFSQLKAKGYQRTFGIWTADADTTYPEAGWLADQLQEAPGSNTWAYKDIVGVTVGGLTNNEASLVKNKNASTFETIGGLRRTVGGKMFGGEWIDVMVFIDWLQARMSERIWSKLANAKKIPYTQEGVTIIEAEIHAQLREGIRNGGLANAPAPTVSVPDVLDIAENVRGSRVFDGITFNARLAGAIHFVSIRGVVTA